MKLPEEFPPRLPGETAIYEDDPFELGEIAEARLRVVNKTFLPPPNQLVLKNPQRKITITLDQMSIDFFKAEAKSLRVPYQRLIRNLIANYAQAQTRERQERDLLAEAQRIKAKNEPTIPLAEVKRRSDARQSPQGTD